MENIYRMLGYKLFKQDENDNIHMVRIVNMRMPFNKKNLSKATNPSEITIFDYNDNQRKKVRVDSLKGYTPLEPDGIFTASIGTIRDGNNKVFKDVICTITRYLMVKAKISCVPYAVCRQNITDVFANLFLSDESQMLVGLAINQEDCPANFDYKIMLACEDILDSVFINFYKTDTIDDILNLFKTTKYDEALSGLYLDHASAVGEPSLVFKKYDMGWCKDLKTLLKTNDFQSDINQMFNILQVDFNITDFCEEKELPTNKDIKYLSLNEDIRHWLSSLNKVDISEGTLLEYDHDINLGDFYKNNYLLVRDNTKKLYIVVYTVGAEMYEADLEEESKKYNFLDKFKLDLYNKYNSNNK